MSRFLASNIIYGCSHTTWDAIMCTYFVNRKRNNCLIKNFSYIVSCTMHIHWCSQLSPFFSLCTGFCNGLLYSMREQCAQDAKYSPHVMLCLLSHIIFRGWMHLVFVAMPVNFGQKLLKIPTLQTDVWMQGRAYPANKIAFTTLSSGQKTDCTSWKQFGGSSWKYSYRTWFFCCNENPIRFGHGQKVEINSLTCCQ